MAGTLTEQTRALHEDVERLEDAAVQFLLEEPKTHKDTVNQSHRLAQVLDLMNDKKDRLIEIYKDIDNARQKDIDAMAGGDQGTFSVFYERLRDIKDYHRRFPAIPVADPAAVRDTIRGSEDVRFSAEESYGRYLDLHEFHDRFNNLAWNKGTPLDYFAFLRVVLDFPSSRLAGQGEDYVQYLRDLYEYTRDWFRRAQPLTDVEANLRTAEENFEAQWAAQQLDGETHRAADENASAEEASSPVPATFCLDCMRLFKNAGSFNGHLGGKRHKKNAERHAASHTREIFRLQALLHCLGQMLSEQLDATKIYVETKLARRYEDLEAEAEEEEVPLDEEDSDSDSEAEEMSRRCIQNYPTGWDGKPIPYWLYKLHGLGIEYKCEICGNTSYWGRRAYERHFQEGRHAYGMKCLGIPNTRAFHEITNINDALALWEKMKGDQKQREWNPAEMEEYEDAQGNVMSKKTYKDLERQGIKLK